MCVPLANIINSSLTQGNWADCYRQETINPKQYPVINIDMLRPISPLFSFNKVQEMTVCDMIASLFHNFNGSSKYNDDLTQHGTLHYRLDAKKIRINEKKMTGHRFFKVFALLGHIVENFLF